MRGLIINPAVRFEDQAEVIGFDDPHLTRIWLLFWDKLLVTQPSEGFRVGLSQDLSALQSRGIVEVFEPPPVTVDLSDLPDVRVDPDAYWRQLLERRRPERTLSDMMIDSRNAAFAARELDEPGSWAVGDAPNMWPLPRGDFGRGIQFNLVNALPVPDRSVPLDDILEFKLKRQAECDALLLGLDGLYEDILRSADRPVAERRAVGTINTAVRDLQRVTRERGFGTRLVDFGARYVLAADVIDRIVALSPVELPSQPMQGVAAAILGFQAFNNLFGSNSPGGHAYSYVAQYHSDVFGEKIMMA